MKSFPRNNNKKKLTKKMSIDVAPINEVKEMFMNWFKKNNKVGQIMTKQDVITSILTKLDAKQNEALEEAMHQLKSGGLITIQEDGVTLVLTEKGSNSI